MDINIVQVTAVIIVGSIIALAICVSNDLEVKCEYRNVFSIVIALSKRRKRKK